MKIINRIYKVFMISALMGLSACGWVTNTGYQEFDGQWYWVVQRGLLPDLSKTLLDVDHESFEVLNQQGYAKDNAQVLFSSLPVAGADAASFKVLTNRKREVFAVDKNQAYVLGLPINGSDPNTFEVVNLNYSRDRTQLFCGTFKIEGVDPDNFEVIKVNDLWVTIHDQPTIAEIYGEQFATGTPVLDCSGWGRDKQYYYYGPARLEGADYDSFVLIDEFTAKDKHGVFNGRNKTTY